MKLTHIYEKLMRCCLLCFLATGLLQGCQTATVKEVDSNTPRAATAGQKTPGELPAKKQRPARQMPAVNNTEIQAKAESATSAKKTKQPTKPKPKAKTSTKTRSTVTQAGTSSSDSKSRSSTESTIGKQASGKASAASKSVGSANNRQRKAIKEPQSVAKRSKTGVNEPPVVADNKDLITEARTTGSVGTAEPSENTTSDILNAELPQEAASPEETQLALVELPALDDGKSGISGAMTEKNSGINLTADMLPHSFGVWTLERNWDNQHPQICRLRSTQTTINDGYEATYLWAEILPDEINIYTGSNIDLSYEGSGLQFGNRPVQAFTGFLTETAVNIAGDYRRALVDASALTVYLGFWPTWPKTEINKVSLPSQDLKQALSVFEACQTWSE